MSALGGRRPAWGWAWLLALVLTTAGRAEPPELRAETVFGVAQSGRPIPLAVEVTAVGQAADGRLRVPLGEDLYGFPHLLYEAEVDVPIGGSKVYWLTLWPTATQIEIPVEYVDRKGRVWRRDVKVRQEAAERDYILAVVDPSESGLRYLQREAEYIEGSVESSTQPDPPPPPEELREKLKHRAIRVANLTATDLPRDPAAYLALDALLIQGAELTAAEPVVRDAIAAWVRQGGTLVLAGGAASRGLFQDPVIAELAPVKVTGLTEVTEDDLSGLSPWMSGRRIGPRGTQYAIGQAKAIDGETLLRAGGVPLVQQARRGRGTVTYVGAPFDQAPLGSLVDLEGFWHWLLRPDETLERRPLQADALPLWVWQIRAALEIGGVETPSLILVGCFLLAYLIVLVPGQYLALRKLRRRELAWVMTPAIVAAFSVGAYLIGTTLKGRQVVVQSVSMVDAVSGAATAQAVTTAVVYSPARAQFEVDLPPGAGLVRELNDAVPQYGYYGGSDAVLSQDGQLRLRQTGVRQRVEDFDVAMWAARVLGFCWTAELPGTVGLKRLPGGPARVQVRNGLTVPLRHAVVTDDSLLWVVGDVAPQKTTVPAKPQPLDNSDARLHELLKAMGTGERIGQWGPAALEKLLDPPSIYGGMGMESTAAVMQLGGTVLWAFVEPPDGPLTLVDHGSDDRPLWLLRVAAEPAP